MIPPGLQPFVKQLYESGFQKDGGVLCAVFYDENLLNYHPAAEVDGLISCLDYYRSINDPFSKSLQEAYARKFPGTKYSFTAGTGGTGMYRGVKFYEAAVKETGGKLDREEVTAALDHAVLRDGPGGGAEIVPDHYHTRMNMYIALCKNDAGKARHEVIDKAPMVDPKEC